jgi:diphthine-ammonia ligase
MQEIWQAGNGLIEKENWGTLIESLKTNLIIKDKEEAKKILQEKLISSVKERIPKEKFGIFFSGGVDSSLIAALCAKQHANFTCYSVGFQEDTKEPEDIVEAIKVAKKLNFDLKYKIFTLDEAEVIIKETVSLLQSVGKNDVVNVGVGSVILAAAEMGKNDGIKHFLGGLGSEEIFAGYERHAKAINAHEECWKGLKLMWGRDLVRDCTLAKALNISVGTPFLDKELIKFSMKIPEEWKISEEEKKIILREVAEEFLGEFAWRKKKAAQYGSSFDKAISKLARKNGFKLKKDWLDSL